ncbi:FUSC family protein [Pseudalkalibacillus caeni]|uniref:FUSC family protein n=1 Tax=Exobacillus caeni TaxID=2574798 RepID=A0A5R9EWG9_9BACL|nr:FUSC family protein [Pseudalkalibacillus caeni]TLS35387.1 FUSC family protein [Pseudalkalibacillus caeni]
MKKRNSLQTKWENKKHLVWKMALASGISWEAAKIAGSSHPYLAPLSVILCLQTTIGKSIHFSLHRIIGTVIGVSVTALIASHLSVNGWTLGLLILGGTLLAKLLKLDETALHQVALTILLVFVFENKTAHYPVDRIRDTVIGALTAVVVHMVVFPPNFTKEAITKYNRFSNLLANSFYNTVTWLEGGCAKSEGDALQKEVRSMLSELHQTKDGIKQALNSLEFNPLSRKKKTELLGYKRKLNQLSTGLVYLEGAIETLRSWSAAGTMTAVNRTTWANQFQSMGSFYLTDKNSSERNNVILSAEKQVTLPYGTESQQYNISLYESTDRFLKSLYILPKNKS